MKIVATSLWQRKEKNGDKSVACVVSYNIPYMERPAKKERLAMKTKTA